MARYTVIWSEQAKAERGELHAFLRPGLERAVRQLQDQAEIETLHRKRLERLELLPPEYPDPTWSLRVGQHRVLYAVEGRTVTVLRVILKGRKVLGERL
jgi:mRNA-degrading endonuclease RelE of RelBE toxin-antitoxin system